ncbi:MMPL family transporter [Myxococcota bacterium]|nr:MMPL family transporter [Myxococcota bacterium]MBU1381203.1 MMPL family transporter [Myxococcota bacterium]MBU1495625.1 MMPL family transporter [Myxococcota bacterium]
MRLNQKLSLIIAAVLVVISIFFAPRLKIDNSIGALASPGKDLIKFRNNLQRVFGSDNYIFIVFPVHGSISEFESNLRVIAGELKQLRGVSDVSSIFDALDSLAPMTGAKGLNSLDKSSKFFEESALYSHGNWLSIVITSSGKDGRLPEKLRKFLNAKNIEYYITGESVINHYLESQGDAIGRRYIPLYIIFSISILLILFRSLPVVVLIIITMLGTVSVSLALVVLTGGKLTIVSNILPMVILVVCVETLIHAASSFIREKVENTENPIASGMERIKNPCVFSILTTMAGFSAFLFSPMSAMRLMAVYVIFGLLFTLFFTLYVFPILSEKIKLPLGKRYREASIQSRFSDKTITAVIVLIIIVSIYYAFKLQIETRNINYLPLDSKVYKDALFIEKNVTGLNSIEVVLRGSKGTFYKSENIRIFNNNLDVFGRALIAGPHTPILILKELMLSKEVPWSVWGLLSKNRNIRRFVSPDGSAIRFTISLKNSDFRKIEDARKIAETVFKKRLEKSGLKIRVETGGVSVETGKIMHNIVFTLFLSTALAVLFVFILMLFQFRSLFAALLSMIPSVLSIGIMYSLMGLTKTTLDAGSVLISAITMGISIDATIHFMKNYMNFYESGLNPVNSVERSLAVTLRPVMISTFVISAGFAAFALSSFPPLRKLGIFTAAAVLISFILTVVALPALLRLLHPLIGREKQSQ